MFDIKPYDIIDERDEDREDKHLKFAFRDQCDVIKHEKCCEADCEVQEIGPQEHHKHS